MLTDLDQASGDTLLPFICSWEMVRWDVVPGWVRQWETQEQSEVSCQSKIQVEQISGMVYVEKIMMKLWMDLILMFYFLLYRWFHKTVKITHSILFPFISLIPQNKMKTHLVNMHFNTGLIGILSKIHVVCNISFSEIPLGTESTALLGML